MGYLILLIALIFCCVATIFAFAAFAINERDDE